MIHAMRILCSITIGIALILAAGCEQGPAKLRLVRPEMPVDAEIMQDVVDLLGQNASVSLMLTDAGRSDDHRG